MISKSGGMSGTIMIKDKKELKQLEDKLAQAKKLYNIKETAERDKRIQRAKDMIKFYDKQKKAALKYGCDATSKIACAPIQHVDGTSGTWWHCGRFVSLLFISVVFSF